MHRLATRRAERRGEAGLSFLDPAEASAAAVSSLGTGKWFDQGTLGMPVMRPFRRIICTWGCDNTNVAFCFLICHQMFEKNELGLFLFVL